MDAELQWDAAILTVMVDGGAQGADDAGSRALQSMVSAWREAPVAGTLSQKVGKLRARTAAVCLAPTSFGDLHRRLLLHISTTKAVSHCFESLAAALHDISVVWAGGGGHHSEGQGCCRGSTVRGPPSRRLWRST